MSNPPGATLPRAGRGLPCLVLTCALLAASCAAPSGQGEYDPWQPLNRKVFWFNMQMDEYVLEPTARGWDAITSEGVRTAFGNFFSNLRFPVHLVNNLLQAKFGGAVEETGRFVVNTTIGLLGFFDPATDAGLEAHPEDFGQTLGVWGLGSGPYVMLPFLGPSSVRGTVGVVGDYLVPPDWTNDWRLVVPGVVNDRAVNLELIANAQEASLDFYAFVRNAYLQRRRALVADEQGADRSLYATEEGEAGDDALYDDPYEDDLYADPFSEDGYDDADGSEEGEDED